MSSRPTGKPQEGKSAQSKRMPGPAEPARGNQVGQAGSEYRGIAMSAQSWDQDKPLFVERPGGKIQMLPLPPASASSRKPTNPGDLAQNQHSAQTGTLPRNNSGRSQASSSDGDGRYSASPRTSSNSPRSRSGANPPTSGRNNKVESTPPSRQLQKLAGRGLPAGNSPRGPANRDLAGRSSSQSPFSEPFYAQNPHQQGMSRAERQREREPLLSDDAPCSMAQLEISDPQEHQHEVTVPQTCCTSCARCTQEMTYGSDGMRLYKRGDLFCCCMVGCCAGEAWAVACAAISGLL